MKAFFTILVVVVFINGSYSQAHKEMTLPLFKENSKVDSLLDKILPNNSIEHIYFSINALHSPGSGHMLSIMQLKNKGPGIYYVFMLPQYMINFGYFKYKGRTIFMVGDTEPYGVFSKSYSKKSFDFIWEKENVYEVDEKLFFGIYEYKDGKFSMPDLREK